MSVQLRGHHLLCLLGYRGIGYSEEYAENMSQVHEQLRTRPDTPIRIVEGPDDLCSCFPENQVNHCNESHVCKRDSLILERLGLHSGEQLSWKDILEKIAELVMPQDIEQWCNTCSWRSLGFCEAGVERVRQGFGLMALPVDVHGVKVYGVNVDHQTRCGHYHSPFDLIALRFPCCDTYYPCYECHEETAGHPAKRWRTEQIEEKAVLCGSCGHQLTIHEYLMSNSVCPSCNANFNPGCRNHYHLYFEF